MSRPAGTWGLGLGSPGLAVLSRLQAAGRLDDLLLAAGIQPQQWQAQGLVQVRQLSGDRLESRIS